MGGDGEFEKKHCSGRMRESKSFQTVVAGDGLLLYQGLKAETYRRDHRLFDDLTLGGCLSPAGHLQDRSHFFLVTSKAQTFDNLDIVDTTC